MEKEELEKIYEAQTKYKLGFFEKWNEEAAMPEFSMTRLQMAIITAFTLAFAWWFFIVKGNTITYPSIMLIAVLLIGAFTPKALKDFIDKIKDKT